MNDDPAGAPRAMLRLHPSSLIFGIGAAARRLLLPGLFVVLFRPGGRYELWLMALFIPAVVAALARFASYRYSPGVDELIVREGIVTRNERHIPYARIQNIDLVQNVLHRALGVAEVRIETASGDRPEAVMRVLSLGAVDEMREHVFRDRAASSAVAETDGDAQTRPAGPARTDAPLVRLGPVDLALLGLVTNRGLALVAAALGVFWQFDPFEQADAEWIERQVQGFDVPQGWIAPGPATTALLAVATVLVALIVLSVLSIGWAVLRYYGFTLRARGDDLRAEYGLLTRISATIPRGRIQQLSTRRGPIHRLSGRASVQVETAGHAQGEDGSSGSDRLWLAPIVAADRVPELIRRVMPDVDPERLDWQPIAVRAWRRIVKRGIALVLVLSAALVPALGWWAFVPFAVGAVLAAIHARLYVRYAGYALAPNAIVYRSGWWSRKLSIVRYAKIQAVALESTPFDRRNRMASVRVDTAGAGRVGHRVDIRYLELAAATTMMGRLAGETAARPFRW